jgi:methionyl-tRNA formyltransferase
VKSFDAPEASSFVSESAPDWVVYGGGGILPPAFIDAAGGRILNAHAGPLPAIRGMNAIEWSLLLDYDPTVTVHVIDRGIDTGAALTWHPVPVQPGDTIEKLRMRSVAIGVEALFQILQHPPSAVGSAEPATQRQCFILAPALRELLDRRLSEGRYAPLVTPGVHGSG